MRKLTKFAAGVMAMTLAAGMVVSAASSSTTKNTSTSSSSSSSSSTTVASEPYIVYRDSTTSTSRQAVVKLDRNSYVRVSSNYSQVTNKDALATAIKPDKATADAMQAYLSQTAAGKTVIGPIKVQMYDHGKAITEGFGTFTSIIGIGAKYNGQTVTAVVRHQDGTVEELELTVQNGRVSIPMTKVGTIAIVL